MKRSRWDEESDDDDERAKAKAAKKALKEAKQQKQTQPLSDSKETIVVDRIPSSELKDTSSKEKDEATKEVPVQIDEISQLSTLKAGLLGRLKSPIPYKPCRSVDNYERLNFIEQGTYGMVFRGRCVETNEIYALKQVKMNPEEVSKIGFPQTAFREINILFALSHPNIIGVREMVVGSTIDKIYMVMEYCENDLKVCMHNNRQSFSTGEVLLKCS